MYSDRVHEQSLNDAVAEVLDELRRDARISQHELAGLAGIPRVSVQRYLAGTRAIRLDDLAAMANALGSDPTTVFARAAARVQREH